MVTVILITYAMLGSRLDTEDAKVGEMNIAPQDTYLGE